MPKKPFISVLSASGLTLYFILCQFISTMIFSFGYTIFLDLTGQVAFDENTFEWTVTQTNWMMIINYFLYALSILVLFRIKKIKITHYVEFKEIQYKNLPLLFMNALALQGIGIVILFLMSNFITLPGGLSEFIHNEPFLLVFISVGILAPLIEEILFRGILFKKLTNHLPWKVANLIQALLFASVHLSLIQFPAALILGLFGGYLYYKTKNIWNSILLHFFFNGFVLILNNLNESFYPLEIALIAICFIISTLHFVQNRNTTYKVDMIKKVA